MGMFNKLEINVMSKEYQKTFKNNVTNFFVVV
jgi:hypothetical protein